MRRKALVMYIIWGICCTIPIGLTASAVLGRFMRENEERRMSRNFARALSQTDGEITRLCALSDYIFNDDEMISALNETYTDNYFEMYLALENTIGPDILHYQFLNDSLEAIRIYTDSGLPSYKKYVYPLSELAGKEWYEQVKGSYDIHWVSSSQGEHELCAVRMLPRSRARSKQNYLCLAVREAALLEPFALLEEKGALVSVRETGGRVLFSVGKDMTAEKAVSFSTTLQNGWTAEYSLSKASFNRTVFPALLLLWLAVTAIIAAMLLGVYFISGIAIRPIEKLSGRVQSRITSGSRKPLTTGREDEVGALTRNFSRLIDEVYESRIQTEEYRLSALYAQMNPHFLYNTLGLINNKAIVNGQDEISHMTLLLSQFYRTSLNRGREITTAENELKNCRMYLEIQQITYENSFSVEWNIDESLLDRQMPNFILQPLLENAVEHGLKDSKKESRIIRVSLALERGEDGEADMIFTIADNGVGMSKETLEGLLSTDRPGVGLKNIHRRLQIYCGEGYGLQIDSREGEGTSVRARIRLREGADALERAAVPKS